MTPMEFWSQEDFTLWPVLFVFGFMTFLFVCSVGAAFWFWRHRVDKHMIHAMGPFALMGYWQKQAMAFRSSGNTAFDEYRKEKFAELDEEFRAFVEFREKLMEAKDREAFDAFFEARNSPSESN